jgi:soluble lytic murein transglycosylase-like protein
MACRCVARRGSPRVQTRGHAGHSGLCAARPACALMPACLLVLAHAQAAPTAAQFHCRFDDGSVRVMYSDVGAAFPLMGVRCAPVTEPVPAFDASAAALAFAGSAAPPAPKRPPVEVRRVAPATWIEAPAPKPLPLARAPAALPPVMAFGGKTDLSLLVSGMSKRYGVDADLVDAVIHVESRYKAHARSPKGALGLMQVMPATGRRYGVDNPSHLLDPVVNVGVGVRYLRDLHEMFGGRVDLVAAAYNAGEGSVQRYGNRIPPYPETRSYVAQVLAAYQGRRMRGRR